MLTIKIIAIGSQEEYYKSATDEYIKRLSKYCNISIIQLKHSDQKRETEDIKQELKKTPKSFTFLCDINGKEITSQSFAQKIENITQTNSTITFIIGGSDGVDNLLLNSHVHEKISFGKITLPHQLFRVILTEQIYRAFTILNNEKYHK